ncbi:MAG TPA: hypothetical protein VK619_01800 [Pyrinomonadaceae bacterium]|nr:hypothetical protein [Pyrinomonadaceae bacterium]
MPALARLSFRPVSNLKSISPTLDLGQGLTVVAFEVLITQTQSALDEYNLAIAALDEKGNQVTALETRTRDMSARMLAGVGALHGKNSDQYEKAGGARQDEIKRTSRKAKEGTATKV